MAEESNRNSAAEIPVTSNGDLDQSPETVFQRVRACLQALVNSTYQNCIIVRENMSFPAPPSTNPSLIYVHVFNLL